MIESYSVFPVVHQLFNVASAKVKYKETTIAEFFGQQHEISSRLLTRYAKVGSVFLGVILTLVNKISSLYRLFVTRKQMRDGKLDVNIDTTRGDSTGHQMP